MIHLDSDYLEGAHPKILQRLLETNLDQCPGYGEDRFCAAAREKIRIACACPEAEIHFLMGGTQTNATVIKALLRPHEGVLAADSGHISLHEAGAVEATGHKVLTLPQEQGRISPGELRRWLQRHYQDVNRLHMVKPGLLYLSQPTEYGTLYSKAALVELKAICREYQLPLYLDGARLGYGLAADSTELELKSIAQICDLFYIGGTKQGALCGEALVIPRPGSIPGLFSIIKQSGALLAKGRLLGIQFDALFTDDLYLESSRHAIAMANALKTILREKGYRFYVETPTNQQFIILENQQLEKLAEQVSFSFWETLDDHHSVVRLATSWATREEDIQALRDIL